MKKILLFSILVFAFNGLKSQQNQLFNQSLFNYYQLNSAYAGSKNISSFGIGISKLWTSVDGAPFSQYVSFHKPLKESNVGLGMLLTNDQIGLHRTSSLHGTFAYHMLTGKGKFSLGIDLGLKQASYKFSELNLQETDLIYPEQGVLNTIVPKFNFSALYQSNHFIAGIKFSNLLQGEYNFSEMGIARDYLHADLLLGIAKKISNKVVWKPYLVVNATSTNQLAYDISSNLTLMEQITFGISYRNDKNLNLISHLFVRNNVRLGYSYEFSLINLSTKNPNSHELFMGINFGREKGDVTSPRFYSL